MSDEIANILRDSQEQNPDVRELALDRIGMLKPNNAIELILPFLKDSDLQVRSTAVCNLGLIQDSRAVPYLVDIVAHDCSEQVRTEAIISLAEYRSPEILNCLVAEVDREKRSRRPRQEVAKQLRYYNAEAAVDALVILLQDTDVFVRDHAAESLLYLNRPRLRMVWKEALNDQSYDVQEIAIKALTELDHTTHPSPHTLLNDD
ncbi:HEAT repeat domain-containing protein [Nostoc sp. UHCC 0702]|nr:HEAT repeat domain-containing protein [Nostoc sp. UHCC 0702]